MHRFTGVNVAPNPRGSRNRRRSAAPVGEFAGAVRDAIRGNELDSQNLFAAPRRVPWMRRWFELLDLRERRECYDLASESDSAALRRRFRLSPEPRQPDDDTTRAAVGGGASQASLHERDTGLVRAVQAGESGAFEQLVERMGCLPRILDGLNARMGRPLSDHDLADVAQDTLVLVWRKLDTFNGSASLETWVFGIARFELMNAVRKNRRRRASELPEPDLREAPEPDSTHRLDHEVVQRELGALDSALAEVIRMKHFDDLTFEQIGAQLGQSINTVKTRYYRGISRLLDRLGTGFRGREAT
jgi:RNA polymerase sigma-70 factor (ECF subfamily)